MRVLLTSPTLPFPPFRDGRDNLHVNYGNATYGQDIFSVPTRMHAYGLHLIAQNIQVPVTVLENPTKETFTREVKRGYDIVGIGFVLPFFSRVLEMAGVVRTCSPRSRVILGGPGVQCFSHATGREEDLLRLVDAVCRGDGVAFMRRMLGEDVRAPVQQDLPLGAVIPLRFRFLQQESATLVSTLGCSNSCEFCAASSFFGHQRTQLATPRQLYEATLQYLRKYPVTSARILDDNFLVDRHYVREYGELIRNDSLCRERGFTYCTFANLAAIAQYDMVDLVRWGLSGVLIGIESTYQDQLPPRVQRKMKGIDAAQIIRNLLDHGIFVEGSMILGWDFHTRDTIMGDIDRYVSLGATFDQIVPLIPVPETRVWEQLKDEGRLSDRISWDDTGFYVRWHRFRHLTHEEVWNYEVLAQRRCFETWGPSFLRLMDVHIRGYRKFRDADDATLQRVAQGHKDDCITLYPVLRSARLFAPSAQVRTRVDELRSAYHREFGRAPYAKTLTSWGVAALASYRKAQRYLFREDTVQPASRVYTYNA